MIFCGLSSICEISAETASTIGIIVDVVIVLTLVIYALVGLSKGFIESFLKILGSVGAVALAIFTAKPVLAFVNGIVNVSQQMGDFIISQLTSMSTVFTLPLADEAGRTAALTALSTVDSLFGIVKNLVTDLVTNTTLSADLTVGQLASSALGSIACTIIAGILIFIIAKIIIKLLSKLFETKDAERGHKSGMDKLLGLVFGAAKGALVVAILFLITSLVSYTGLGDAYINPVINETTVVKPAYEFVSDKVEELIMSQDWNAIIAGILSGND